MVAFRQLLSVEIGLAIARTKLDRGAHCADFICADTPKYLIRHGIPSSLP